MKQQPVAQKPSFDYVDSTLYFSERQSSVSLRATFKRGSTSGMAEGYQFQFRTISAKPVFLDSISIIAGGKRLFLEEGQIVLPGQRGVTFRLSLQESLVVAGFPSALLQFRYNNDSYMFAIELHQLREFVP